MWFDDFEPFQINGFGPPFNDPVADVAFSKGRADSAPRWADSVAWSDGGPQTRSLFGDMAQLRHDDGSSDFRLGRLLPIVDDTVDTILKSSFSTEPPEATGEDIVVTGTLPPMSAGGVPGGGTVGPGGLTDPHAGIETNEGEAPPTENPNDDLDHDEKCTSVAGAADQIRDKIVSTETDSSTLTTSHQQVEYGTLIVNNGEGTFGAAQQTIYSDSSASFVRLTDNLPANPSTIVGVIHNHAGSPSGDYFTNVSNAYPSNDDWASLSYLVQTYNLDPATTSMWVIDAWGNMREFKYGDMEEFQQMTDAERRDPNNLPAKNETQGCGSGS